MSIALSVWSGLHAQRVLTEKEAVRNCLEHNFQLKLAENALTRAELNTSDKNTGKLPTVAFNAGYNYNVDNTTANFQDGRQAKLDFASSRSINGGLNVGYVIFDGFFRKYNIAQLQEQYSLSELEMKASMENLAAQTLSQYYQLAAQINNLKIVEESIGLSLLRLERVREQREFSRATGLDVLSAEVDLNNDSLALTNAQIQMDNAKRVLNNLMVNVDDLDYTVSEEVSFIEGLDRAVLQEEMLAQNIALSQIDKNIEIGSLSIDMAKARQLPTIRADLNYGFGFNRNNPASFLASLNTNGLTASVSLQWNLFDGGQTRVNIQQNELNRLALDIQKDQLIENLQFRFETAWANYKDSQKIYQSQAKNVALAEANMVRTEERYNAGQLDALTYRQAQLNLLNAQVAENGARYQVKLAEVEILLLSGRVLD